MPTAAVSVLMSTVVVLCLLARTAPTALGVKVHTEDVVAAGTSSLGASKTMEDLKHTRARRARERNGEPRTAEDKQRKEAMAEEELSLTSDEEKKELVAAANANRFVVVALPDVPNPPHLDAEKCSRRQAGHHPWRIAVKLLAAASSELRDVTVGFVDGDVNRRRTWRPS